MKKIFGILILLVVTISLSVASSAFANCIISARKWHLAQVEFTIEVVPETDALIKESIWKENYHIDSPDKSFNANCWLPIPEYDGDLNTGRVIEWNQLDSSTGFQSGDESVEATLIYADSACRWMPELDGLNPMDAKKYGAIFYAHRKWNYEAAKIVTVSDRIQFLGGGKFRVGFIEESENCYDEEGNLEVITFRTYGLIPGADFSKNQGGKSKPSGGGGTKPSGGGSTGLITPTPGGDDPNPPTPSPPPAETHEPDPQEDPIETLAPRNTPPPAANEPNPEEDKIILAPRSDGKESSAPTAASSSTNVEASSSSSSSETTNTSSTTTTTTETSSTSDTSSTSSADTSNNGTPDDSSAAGQPNAVEDEIVLVPRGGG